MHLRRRCRDRATRVLQAAALVALLKACQGLRSQPSAAYVGIPRHGGLRQDLPGQRRVRASHLSKTRLLRAAEGKGKGDGMASGALVEDALEASPGSVAGVDLVEPKQSIAAGQSSDAGSSVELVLEEQPLPPSLALLVLGAVTIFWGAQHTAIKVALDGSDTLTAGVLNSLRFILAAGCFAYWLPPLPSLADVEVEREWRGGAELGVWLFLGFFLQTLGLLYTSAQRSALLLYLNVKLVPFLGLVLLGQAISKSTWIVALTAFAGTLLVAGDGSNAVPLNIGDALSLGAACASAMFILRLETYAVGTDSRALNSVTMLFVALLSCVWTCLVAFQDTLVDPHMTELGPRLWERATYLIGTHGALVFYLGVVTTAFTNWLQTIGQRSVPATVASAVYALDPLWGCVFAYFFLGEVLGPQGLLGCAVLLGVWLYQWLSVSSWQADMDTEASK